LEQRIIKREKLFNSQYFLVNLVVFIGFFSEYINTTTFPLYSLTIGGNEASAGAFMTVVCFTALFFRPVFGYIMDVKSRQFVLVLGTLSLALAGLSYSYSTSIVLILTLATLQGIGISSLSTAGPTVVADVTPPARLAEGISLYGNAMNLTTAFAPLVALIMIQRFSYAATYRIAFAISFIAIILALYINYEKKPNMLKGRSNKREVPFSIGSIFEKTALKPSLYQLSIAFGSAIVWTFIPLYGKSRGIENIGLFFTVFSASTLLISLFTGKLIQKYQVGIVFIPALLLQFIAFISLAYAQSLLLVLIAASLYGIGYGSSFAIVNYLGMEAAPEHRRGAANATLYAAMDIGIALGSIILGLITAQFGFTITFIVAAAIIGWDIILYLLLNIETNKIILAQKG